MAHRYCRSFARASGSRSTSRKRPLSIKTGTSGCSCWNSRPFLGNDMQSFAGHFAGVLAERGSGAARPTLELAPWLLRAAVDHVVAEFEPRHPGRRKIGLRRRRGRCCAARRRASRPANRYSDWRHVTPPSRSIVPDQGRRSSRPPPSRTMRRTAAPWRSFPCPAWQSRSRSAARPPGRSAAGGRNDGVTRLDECRPRGRQLQPADHVFQHALLGRRVAVLRRPG